MNYKPRLLAGKLRRMLDVFAVVVVSGARQVGKTTLAQRELPEWDMVVFDPTIDVGNARQDPDLFLDNHPSPAVLDEIQYAPELTAALKRRVDRLKRPGMYVLTGSQQWSVLKSISESMAGRAAFLDLNGFCLSEIAESTTEEHWLKRYLENPQAFVEDPPKRLPPVRTLYEQLWRGSLPEADSLDIEWIGQFHQAYLRTYVERDTRLLSDVQDWQQFGRFVQLSAALTAQEVNYSKLGRDVGVTSQTAQRWLGMLRATFQWFDLPAYHGSAVKRISSKPKGYLADTGLASSLQMISSPNALGGHPLVGALFESAVVGEVRKLSATLAVPPNLYHWRTHGGAEVDLLLERDGTFFPIEVKLRSHPSRKDAAGIESFRRAYPKLRIAPGLVVAPTERFSRLSESAHAMPWDSR